MGKASQQKVCEFCQTTETPSWRRSSSGKVACNSCGLFLKASNAPRKLSIGQKDGQRIVDQSSSSGICTCCGAQNIPVWRKDDAGMPICGECALISKLRKQQIKKPRSRANSQASNISNSGRRNSISAVSISSSSGTVTPESVLSQPMSISEYGMSEIAAATNLISFNEKLRMNSVYLPPIKKNDSPRTKYQGTLPSISLLLEVAEKGAVF